MTRDEKITMLRERMKERGIDANRIHEEKLTAKFLKGLRPLEQDGLLKIAGLKTASGDRTAVVSVQTLTVDPAEAAYLLDEKYGIMTRVGLHCAPAAHRSTAPHANQINEFQLMILQV